MPPQPMSVERSRKIHNHWNLHSRHGMLFFILTRGLVLFSLAVACLALFTYRNGTLPIFSQYHFFPTLAAEVAVVSFGLPALFYLLLRSTVARLKRHRPHSPAPTPAAPENAP